MQRGAERRTPSALAAVVRRIGRTSVSDLTQCLFSIRKCLDKEPLCIFTLADTLEFFSNHSYRHGLRITREMPTR